MFNRNMIPLSVIPYNRDSLIDFVRHKTGWTQRSQVTKKQQLKYLCDYLEVDHVDVKTMVFEDEYIDRPYLEDYSEYYARCFAPHPKVCSRVHFFSIEFDRTELTDALKNNDQVFFDTLKDKYQGYAVIRPVPHTCFAKVCIKPYEYMTEGQNNYRIIVNEHNVTMFGIPLTIKTAAYIEQDKVVAACATSAMWTLLSVGLALGNGLLPSPSSITKAACQMGSGSKRTFPNTGLSINEVSRALKSYGLEPTSINPGVGPDLCTNLKEIVYAYISNDIPLMIGGAVYTVDEDEKTKLRGRHFVTALGFHLNKASKAEDGMNLKANLIDKIYIHDDRYGPFVQIETKLVPFKCDNDGAELKNGFKFGLHKSRKDFFVPDVITIGANHKVRISYASARGICSSLHAFFLGLSAYSKESVKQEQEEEGYSNLLIPAIKKACESTWDLKLTDCSSMKKMVTKSESFLTFNGAANKTSLLLQNLPRHIWLCRIKGFADILLDATEIPQGFIMLGYITYCEDAARLFQYMDKQMSQRVWQNIRIGDELEEHFGCIIKFFDNDPGKMADLNTLYGMLGTPARSLKDGEYDDYQNIERRNDVLIIRRGHSDWNAHKFVESKKYIWVIDELGDLVVGEDIEDLHNGNKGHPTLMDGKPARLGGELFFDSIAYPWKVNDDKQWHINLKSRAYSGHLRKDSDEANFYLKNVIEENFRDFLLAERELLQ